MRPFSFLRRDKIPLYFLAVYLNLLNARRNMFRVFHNDLINSASEKAFDVVTIPLLRNGGVNLQAFNGGMNPE